jgi:hypothetical protein
MMSDKHAQRIDPRSAAQSLAAARAINECRVMVAMSTGPLRISDNAEVVGKILDAKLHQLEMEMFRLADKKKSRK